MPMRDLADLERRIRRLEMGVDQSRHKLVVPERTVSVAPPLGAGDVPYVDLSTDQNVAGVKTFVAFPVTPSSAPTSDYDVANKKYVDMMPGRYIPTVPVMVNATTGIPIGVYEVDAVGDWGIPASAKAVVLRASPRFATIDNSNYLAIRPTLTAPVGDENVMVIRGQAPNIYTELIGFCGLTGGKFYYEVAGEATGSWSSILIIGYFT